MTTENNKIIAEFMGMKPIENKAVDGELDGFWTNTIKAHKFDTVLLLSFHTDWNWLMEVVEKIESLGYSVLMYKTANTGVNYCEVNEPIKNKERCIAFKHSRETKIQSVYNACVEFIKWYNEQNK